MIASFFAGLSGKLIAAALIFLVAAGLAFGAIKTFHSIIDNAVASAKAERDAHWQAEIAKSNAEVASAKAIQAETAMRLEAQTASAIRDAETKQQELEKANAALPSDSGCGLRHDRVRLLNAQ